MPNYRFVYSSLIAVLFIGMLSIFFLQNSFFYPFPQAKISPLEKYVVVDLAGITGGFRRLAADIAWIELLVYYGEPKANLDQETQYKISWDYLKFYLGFKSELGHEHNGHVHYAMHDPKEEKHEEAKEDIKEFNESKKLVKIDRVHMFPELYDYCQRIILLDPFFDYIYLYGAGALAWNQDRPEEAVALLNQGISIMEVYRKDITKDLHQPFWQLHLYMGAIIYRKEGNFQKMTESLEVAVTQKNCPNIVKAILSSIYKKDKQYDKALKLWFNIYDTKDPSYSKRAVEEILELKRLLNI